MKKILVTGGNGVLGSSLNFENFEIVKLSKSELNFTNRKETFKKLSEISPDVIIHAGAFTNVEKCETEKEEAYKINTIGTLNLVNWAIGKNVFFVYVSSTGIYGTEKNEPYTEFDEPKPTTIHHKSKFEAEKIVKTHLRKHLIVRTGWLFGGSIESGKNFVYKRFLEAKNVKLLEANSVQIGNPTFVENLSKQLEVLIDDEVIGTFNITDHDSASRFEYISEIAKLFDLKTKVIPTDNFKRVAPVSHNESAINYKLQLLELDLMEDWRLSLKRYISNLKDLIKH
jgi:dTDP-4-dehydrorhamnose reductase